MDSRLQMQFDHDILIHIHETDLNEGLFNVPEFVKRISGFVFMGRTGLTQLTFPAGIRIDDAAFYGCTSLRTLTLSEGAIIGNNAFHRCLNLTHLTLSEGVTIGESAFYCCTVLRQLIVPAGVRWLYPFKGRLCQQ
jgi:hypothetical protein